MRVRPKARNGQKVIQAGRDLRRSLFQPAAQSRVDHEIRGGSSGHCFARSGKPRRLETVQPLWAACCNAGLKEWGSSTSQKVFLCLLLVHVVMSKAAEEKVTSGLGELESKRSGPAPANSTGLSVHTPHFILINVLLYFLGNTVCYGNSWLWVCSLWVRERRWWRAWCWPAQGQGPRSSIF